MMPRQFASLLLLGLLLGCATGDRQAQQLPMASQPYVLAPGDQLEISIFGEERLSGVYRIDQQGRIAMPLIGHLQAGGELIDEFDARLGNALTADILVDPDVVVRLANPQPIYVRGEVRRPGSYDYQQGLTLEQAITLAGDFTYRANRNVVFITHRDATEEVVYDFDLGGKLAPGDTVRVGQRFF